jgi:tetratricopeptide (TPR) repeat protein
VRRDMGVALAELLSMNKVPATLAGKTLDLIEEALGTVPEDAGAWEGKAIALQHINRADAALAAYQEALRLEPNRESSVVGAGLLTLRAGQRDQALQYWQRARELNPWRPLHHGSLAILYIGRARWRDAKEECEAWVRQEPGNTEARRLLTMCQLRLGDRASATKEFAIVEALKPTNLAALQSWWRNETEGTVSGYPPPGR